MFKIFNLFIFLACNKHPQLGPEAGGVTALAHREHLWRILRGPGPRFLPLALLLAVHRLPWEGALVIAVVAMPVLLLDLSSKVVNVLIHVVVVIIKWHILGLNVLVYPGVL